MEKKKLGKARLVLRGDTVVLLVCLGAAVRAVQVSYDYMSFAGFASLFVLLFQVPYLWAIGGALVLVLIAERNGRALLAGIAAGLQAAAPIPWLLLITRGFGGTLSWLEAAMVLGMLAGAAVLLTLPSWKKWEHDP